MGSTYYEKLIRTVIDNSEEDTWKEAVEEWKILDCEEDQTASSSCICGKENIRYLYTIKNVVNGNLLYPIGSSCITKFERADLKEEISVREGMFKLLHAIQANNYISLTADLFSRKLLKHLFDEGAFHSNQYNAYSGENDYQFLVKMFNKRDKSSISDAQKKKIRAIIVSSIKPYLVELLGKKIR
ncbi:MAG: hypothetical protein PHX08_24505 [Lachnospiraceae bacterium]|nr:hypothetical protein [Lachnospiraceae bacterium]